MTDARPSPSASDPASQPIHRVAALRDVRIPVSDGLELSANLWLPGAGCRGRRSRSGSRRSSR